VVVVVIVVVVFVFSRERIDSLPACAPVFQ